MDRHPGCCENAGNARLAQWESACLTRRWSQVQILHRALGGPAGGRRRDVSRGSRGGIRQGPLLGPPGASRRKSQLPCAPAARCGEFRFALSICERGGAPFHTFPPVTRAPNLRFAAILFFRLLGGNGQERRSPTGIARQRETCTDDAAPRQSHGGAPVSDRHRAGARNPHRRRRAPPISRPGAPVSDRHRAGARNLHRRRRAPPISWPRTHASPTAQNHGDMERRSPTGIARERETCTNNAAPRQSHGGAPVSDRHRAGARNLHRRRRPPPISWPRQSHGGAPVSDRHRAGARNLHRRRRATPISRWSAGLRPASRGSAKPAPTPPRHANLTVERRSPTGIARERETCDAARPVSDRLARERDGGRRAPISRWSAGLRPASRGSAKPAPTTPPPANLTARSAGAPCPRDSRRYAPRCRCERPHRENWPALPGRPGRRAGRHSTPGRVGNGRNLPGTLLLHLQFWRLGRWRSCTVIR